MRYSLLCLMSMTILSSIQVHAGEIKPNVHVMEDSEVSKAVRAKISLDGEYAICLLFIEKEGHSIENIVGIPVFCELDGTTQATSAVLTFDAGIKSAEGERTMWHEWKISSSSGNKLDGIVSGKGGATLRWNGVLGSVKLLELKGSNQAPLVKLNLCEWERPSAKGDGNVTLQLVYYRVPSSQIEILKGIVPDFAWPASRIAESP